MKLIVNIILIVFLVVSCSESHVRITEQYSNGKKKIELVAKTAKDIQGDSLITGQRRLYDSLGFLAQTDDYISGKLNGQELWYYPNGNIWRSTRLRNDSAIGFEYELKDNGDTLTANVHYGLSVDGIFYKKWLPDNRFLTGSYGDTDRSFVIWRWLDRTGQPNRQIIDSGTWVNEDFKRFIAPE